MMYRSESSHRLAIVPGYQRSVSQQAPGRGQLQDVSNTSSRFSSASNSKQQGTKTVRLPGKKAAEKKQVFAHRGNNAQCEEKNPGQNPKRLKTVDSRGEEPESAAASRFSRKTGGRQEGQTDKQTSNAFTRKTGNQRVGQAEKEMGDQRVGQAEKEGKSGKGGKRGGKVRLAMPDIPIPVPLPAHVVAERRMARMELEGGAAGEGDVTSQFGDSWGLSGSSSEALYRNLRARDERCVLSPAASSSLCGAGAGRYGQGGDVKPETRRILVDWLLQVQTYFSLHASTLHLAIRLLDQFMARSAAVPLSSYQLVGVTCLFIACKQEERFPPKLAKLTHLTDNTYSEQQIVEMERSILRQLDFHVQFPVAPEYLDYLLLLLLRHAAPVPPPAMPCTVQHSRRRRNLALYLLDLSLPEIQLLQWPAYMVSAAAVVLAGVLVHAYYGGNEEEGADREGDGGADGEVDRKVAGSSTEAAVREGYLSVWRGRERVLLQYTGTTEERVRPLVLRLGKIVSRAGASPHQAATDKYRSHSKYGAISQWPGLALVHTVMEALIGL